MLGLPDYLWRLVPANPILLRVVESAGKRRRDLLIRCAYLGLLVFLVVFSIFGQSVGGASLNELAKMSGQIFRQMSYLQLGLVALLAPIFTAGAITQEKDSQTYDILLATPLTNGQIVLGSLLSRLFFVVALLVSGIPVFSITQIFGGVAIRSIVSSFLIAAATAFVTGALAMAIATFKVGTRRTIFSFYLFIILYLVGGFLLDQSGWFAVLPDPGGDVHYTTWLTGSHPFLALRSLFNESGYRTPSLADLPAELRYWPVGWYLTSPASFYVTFMFVFSALLVAPAIVLLRRLAQSTTTWRTKLLTKLKLSTGERRRKPRYVWSNPIAWREAQTKASASRSSVLRYGFILAGAAAAVTLVVLFATTRTPASVIKPGSYDASGQILTIFKDDGRQMPYVVDPNLTSVTVEGKPASIETMFRGYKEVVSVQANGQNLRTIDLRDIPRLLDAKQVRQLLLGLVLVEFAAILLIVTNAAASTVTREKEDGTLDMLLTSPITSTYYIWGKLRGLVSFVLPLAAVPVLSVLMFVVYDVVRSLGLTDPTFQWVVSPEGVLILPGTLVISAALAAILSMNLSLRLSSTVKAVMSSVGIIVGAAAAMGWCGFALLDNARTSTNTFAIVLSAFSPFTLVSLLIDPWTRGGPVFQAGDPQDIFSARVFIFIFAWVATGLYGVVVWTMYKSMVKNFDMTIRRQSR